MTDEAPANPITQLTQNPWALVVLAMLGGGGIGTATDFIPGVGGQSEITAVREDIADIQRQMFEMQNARDERHEADHFWVACNRNLEECQGFKPDVPALEEN